MAIPGITRWARYLGDWSSINNPAQVPQRFLINRPVGWAGGRIVGGSKKYFGVIGLVAVAEFFSAMSRALKYNASKSVYFGSMASYADWVDSGWTHPASGKSIPPYPFFTTAVKQEQMQSMGLGGFRAPYKMPSSTSSTKTIIRSGIYEGQKFLGDFGQFYKDSSLSGLGGRAIRRETGRQVSGFLFNSLRARKNPMVTFVERVLNRADAFLVPKEDTGILRASLAYGLTLEEFESNSIRQIKRAGASAGMSDRMIESRIAGDGGGGGLDRGAGELVTIPRYQGGD